MQWAPYGLGAIRGPLNFVIRPPNIKKLYSYQVGHEIGVFRAFFSVEMLIWINKKTKDRVLELGFGSF